MRTTNRIFNFLTAVSLFLAVTGFNKVQAQSFDPRDMDGLWERNDGMRISISGTGLFVEGGKAMIFNVGGSGWPESTAHYNFKFQNIKHKANNTWTAGNYKFSQEKRTVFSAGNSIFIMSDDKMEFSCDGSTYYRKSALR